jgi:hypothetical protein
MNKLKLPGVTLVSVSSVSPERNLRAIEWCTNLVEFGDCKLITDKQMESTSPDIKIEKCRTLVSIDEYSKFMIYELNDYIKTGFALVIQPDGVIINPGSWTDQFLDFDYIGAPWPQGMFTDDKGENIRVGNGGFSLRSKKLLSFFNENEIPWTQYRGSYNEDGFISMANLDLLRRGGIKFPSPLLAYQFSREIECPDLGEMDSFGFHNYRGKNSGYPKF